MKIFNPGSSDGVDNAACRGVDLDLFFPDNSHGQADYERREAAAKMVCASCIVKLECLEYALDNNIDSGVWGGFSERERRRARRRKIDLIIE